MMFKIDRRDLPNRVKTSFTSMGNSADSPEPPLRCSGLRTVGDGLANSSIPQPTILANKRSFWLEILANGPTSHCEELANNMRDYPALPIAPTNPICPIKRSFHIVLETYPPM
jgi:hypothetical protein